MFDITKDMDLSFLSQALNDAPIKPIELIKQANVNTDYDQLPNDLFADPIAKQFPIYTPSEAAISALYIYKQASEIDEDVKQTVGEALENYGLTQLMPLLEGEKEMVKVASEENFLLPSKMKFPALDPDMLLKSASVANQNFDRMPLEDRVEVGTNLVKVAEEYEIDSKYLPKWAFVYGQKAACNLEKLSQELGIRHALTKNDNYKDMFESIKELHKQAGEIVFDSGINRKIVLDMIALDKEANVNYDEVNDPFVAVFNEFGAKPDEIEKTATDELATIGGVDFYKDDLAELIESPEGIKILGEDLYKNASENFDNINSESIIAELQSMPEAAQEAIADYLSQYVRD